MSGSKGADVDDQDAADAAYQEMLVLDRLLYRNRSQHRSAKYFTLALEVRRACRTFAAPDVPDLLAKSLGVLARVPDSRNGRAREAWVRSAAAALQRMSIAAVVCAEVLEAIVQASKHLAHQVSQTYFMALSVVFLACLARLFVCSLHLGGRLLEVHGALLRTLLAQPSTSECLPAATLAACRIPEETATFLSRLRGAGRANKLRGVKAPDRAAAATASTAAASRKFVGATPAGPSMPAPFPTAGRTGGKGGAAVEGRDDLGGTGGGLDAGGNDDGDDSDDTGVRIGRAVAVEQVEKNPTAGKVFRSEGAAAAEMVERQGGGRGKAESDVGRTGRGAERGGRSGGDDGGGRDRERRVEPPRKKVILASEFSDSSDDDSDNSSTTRPKQQQQQQQQQSLKSAVTTSPIGTKASRSGSTPRRSSLPPRAWVSSSANKPSHPQPDTLSTTVATASVSLAGDTRGDGSGVVGVGRASAPPEEVPPEGHVGWMIDRGPAFAATPPRCASKSEDDVVLSPSSSPSAAAAAAVATVSPHGEEASLAVPGAPSDVADGVAEGARGKVDGLTVGADTSSDGRSVDNGSRVVDAAADVPGATVTRATTGEGAHVCEAQAFSCVADVEAKTAAPRVEGIAGDPPTSSVSFFGSSSSAVDLTNSCSATGETRRRKKGGEGRKQCTLKRKGPPSSLPTPSMPTPSAVDGVIGYDRKAAAPSPSAPASEEAVSDSRKSSVRDNRGEGAGGGRMSVAGGDIEKDLGGIDGSPTAMSLLPEPALRSDAVVVRAAADAAAAVATAALPLAAPSHREVNKKGLEDVCGSSLPPLTSVRKAGRTSRKKRSEPINSGAGDKLSGSGSGAKRSPAGEARGEMAIRKKKKAKKTPKGSTKRSAGGQAGGRNAIDDIFGSFT